MRQMKMFHDIAHSAMPPAVYLARMMRMTYATPLMSQLFNLWQACLMMSLSTRPTNILSYQIHQQYSIHTIFQLFVESSITISVPRELIEVPHKNFIVQPSLLFHSPRQLMLKRMLCFMIFLFCFIFSISRALYVSFCFQILNNKLVVHVLEKRIMLCFIMFFPVFNLVLMCLTCFFLIYIIIILSDIIMSFL